MMDAKVAEFGTSQFGFGFSPICQLAGCVAILMVICCCFGTGCGTWW
ncbi:MAG: hypothetical protein HPY50_16535 [Firmicutes bacterium]|nr:hypothetical protein [Bacillota bacterium]